MRVLQPSTGSPTPESIRALASLFGGTGGFVSHDTILARLPRSVPAAAPARSSRGTLEAFLKRWRPHARVQLHAPGVGTAKTLTKRRGSNSRSRCTT